MTKVPFNAASVDGGFGKPIDKFKNPTDVQAGTLTIVSTDDSMGTVGPSETEPDNPYAYNVKFTGKAGAFQVQISGDADLGEGVNTITAAETFEVPAGNAVGYGESTVGVFKMNADAGNGTPPPPPPQANSDAGATGNTANAGSSAAQG